MHAERPDAGVGQAGHDALLSEHGEAIGRACMAWLGDAATAQAAVEEIVVTALESQAQSPKTGMGAGEGTAEGTTRGWLFGIVQRVCARRVDAQSTTTMPMGPRAADTRPAPYSAAERTRRALAELPPTERDAIVLRFVAGLTLPDVAQAARVDERTARERVGKGLAKLRALLAGER